MDFALNRSVCGRLVGGCVPSDSPGGTWLPAGHEGQGEEPGLKVTLQVLSDNRPSSDQSEVDWRLLLSGTTSFGHLQIY